MALAVDLIAMNADGTVLWTWMARRWRGLEVVEAVRLPPTEWPQSWQGPVTPEDVERLRERFGGRAAEIESSRPDEDLDALLRRPRGSLLLSVEEWGSP